MQVAAHPLRVSRDRPTPEFYFSNAQLTVVARGDLDAMLGAGRVEYFGHAQLVSKATERLPDDDEQS